MIWVWKTWILRPCLILPTLAGSSQCVILSSASYWPMLPLLALHDRHRGKLLGRAPSDVLHDSNTQQCWETLSEEMMIPKFLSLTHISLLNFRTYFPLHGFLLLDNNENYYWTPFIHQAMYYVLFIQWWICHSYYHYRTWTVIIISFDSMFS